MPLKISDFFCFVRTDLFLPWRPNVSPFARNASLWKAHFLISFLVAMGLVLYCGFLKWYYQHPVAGRIVVVVAVVWCVLKLIGIFRSFSSDLYTRPPSGKLR